MTSSLMSLKSAKVVKPWLISAYWFGRWPLIILFELLTAGGATALPLSSLFFWPLSIDSWITPKSTSLKILRLETSSSEQVVLDLVYFELPKMSSFVVLASEPAGWL